MKDKITPNKIEQAMLVPNYKGVYSIGSTEKGKITVHSQQIRALNLAYALILTKKLYKKNIAIIGCGIAGITISTALSKSSCKLTIFDQHQMPLDLQRKSKREIHPNIFDWPSINSSNKETELPFLNWKFDTAENIIDRLYIIWKEVLKRNKRNIKLLTQKEVTRVEEIKDGDNFFSRVHYNSNSNKNKGNLHEIDVFDFVIYAGGFGLEKKPKSNSTLYWENDNYEQDVKFCEKVYTIFGTGDGGLIDCIRIGLKDFKYHKFLEDFAQDSLFIELGQAMTIIDEAIKPRKNYKTDNEMSTLLRDGYNKIFSVKFKPIKEKFKHLYKKRENVTVNLVGRTDTAFSLNSNVLNRVVLYLMIESGYINYSKLNDSKNLSVLKRIKNAIYSRVKILSNWWNNIKVINIERIGTDSAYAKLFSNDAKNEKLEELNIGVQKYWISDSEIFDNILDT